MSPMNNTINICFQCLLHEYLLPWSVHIHCKWCSFIHNWQDDQWNMVGQWLGFESHPNRTEKYSAVLYYLSPDQFLVVIINASLWYLIYYGQAHFERTFQDFSQQRSDLRVAMCSGIFSWRRFDRRRLFSLLVGFPQSSCSSLPLSFPEFRRRIPFRKIGQFFFAFHLWAVPQPFQKTI